LLSGSTLESGIYASRKSGKFTKIKQIAPANTTFMPLPKSAIAFYAIEG
jgi:hypothetical protein